MRSNYDLVDTVDTLVNLSSGRDMPLAYTLSTHYDWHRPVLTVELYEKWYELFLVEAEGKKFHIYSIHFGHLDDMTPRPEDGGPPFRDHVPNPLFVHLFAVRNDFYLDAIAEELIVGRWEIDWGAWSGMQCDRCEGAGFVPVMFPGKSESVDTTCRACKGHGVLKPGA